LIVEAARAGGCSQLLTEDLDAGTGHDGVTVVNPFARSVDGLRAPVRPDACHVATAPDNGVTRAPVAAAIDWPT
jgi:hypothetical protein